MARPLSPEAQARFLRERFPAALCKVVASELQWRGVLRPTPLSPEYVVRVTYKRGAVQCRVVHPQLEQRDGQRPPHLYPDDRLCLYLPRAFEWDGSHWIADTIVPWAAEWLFFYEVWLATGDWLGGGEHPVAKE